MDGCLYFIVVSASYLSFGIYFKFFNEIPKNNWDALLWFIGAAISIIFPAYCIISWVKSNNNKHIEVPENNKQLSNIKTKINTEKIYQKNTLIELKQQQDEDYYYKRKMARKGYWKVTPKQIYEMDWREFESFVAGLLTEHGYKTILTPAQNDEGKDIVAEKDGIKYFIECKHWKEGSSVGREYLQKLVGAAVGHNVTNVIFIATCSFHDNAKNYAKELNLSGMVHIDLWNMNKLLQIANKIPQNKEISLWKI